MKAVVRFSNKALCLSISVVFKNAIYLKIKNVKIITDYGLYMKKLLHKFPECSQQFYILLWEVRGNINIHTEMSIKTSYENNYLRYNSKIDF